MPNDPIRVLHLLPDLQVGGGQVLVRDLVEGHDPATVEPLVVALDEPADMAEALAEAGSPPLVLNRRTGGPIRAVRALVRLIRERGIDIVHVHSDLDRKYGHVAAFLTRRPVVAHLHSPWNHRGAMVPEGASAARVAMARAKGAVRDFFERATVRRYIAVSKEVRDFHVGLAGAPVVVVANGIDPERFAGVDRQLLARTRRELMGSGDERPLLVCVGRLAPGKGQDLLIRALSDTAGSLVLVGTGEVRSELESLALRLGIGERVRFLGQRGDVEVVLGASDLFVFASESEGLPLSILEAMAAGLAVVAMRLPGLVGLVDETTGVLVDQGDLPGFQEAVRSLAEDEERRTRLGSAAQRRIEDRYDIADTVTAVEQVYCEVVGR
jgi:glycosyltransferase involved in cell wall biosynthesis